MRFVHTLLLLLISHIICSAQYDNANKRDSIKILNAKYAYHKLDINTDEHSSLKLPYDTIVFKDVRYDTTFFAMDYPLFHVSNTYNIKENFYNGFANSVSKYFNHYYSTENKKTDKQLICYIKKFSVALQYDLLENFNAGDLLHDTANVVNIEIECYYKHGDTLFPAVRFDTSYLHFFGFFVNPPSAIKRLLTPLMYKIEQVNLDLVKQRKHFSEDSIKKRYENRFDIPILTTSKYKTGIYRNFNEFKNNSPSIDSFSISTDKIKVRATNLSGHESTSLRNLFQKRNTVLFLYDENDNLISPSQIFGYCDGETIWIQHGSFFYPLVKTGNSFEFMYTFHYADSDGSTHTQYILMPLNMDTGHSN
jgi:hypothetical protein